jgi:DNA (cytosine-5)-methyltransferase 1
MVMDIRITPARALKGMIVTEKLPVVSLFTGAGGLDLGLKRAGGSKLEIRASVEIDADARSTLLTNGLADRGSLFKDITEVQPEKILATANLSQGEAFLLAGGPPCQAFSSAGLRQGIRGSGAMVHNYFEMLQALRPRFFMFENVRGILSAALVHRPLAARRHPAEIPSSDEAALGSVMQKLILPTFKKMGYEVVLGILNSADYGTAQIRHRVIILGSREHEFNSVVFRKQTSRPMMTLDLVPPTHHKTARYGGLQPWRVLKDSIGQLGTSEPAPQDTYTYSLDRANVFANIPPGENWKYLKNHPDFGIPYLERWMGKAALASSGGKEGYYRRLSWDSPAPTLTAQPQQLASSLCHPDRERPLSILEYAALQDFPESFIFQGSKSSRYRQIGNAVPVNLATAAGKAILGVAGEGWN